MAWLTIPALVGPLVGPPVGGFITTFFSWHWIFLINVPIGLLGIWLAGRFLPEIASQPSAPIDFAGFVLSALAASGVVFGLSVVSLPALPPFVGVASMLGGAAAAILYLRHARRRPNPMLDPSCSPIRCFALRSLAARSFASATAPCPSCCRCCSSSASAMTPFQSGMLTFASAIGAIAMKFLAPVTLRLGGFRNVLIGSALSSAFFIAANGYFTPSTSAWVIIAVLIGCRLPALVVLHLGQRSGLRRHR